MLTIVWRTRGTQSTFTGRAPLHSLLVHNSRPNETAQPRRLMIYSHYPSRFNLGDDVRNGPTRVRERPYEQQYLALLESGAYSNQYSLHHG